jgi:hypothetical protein
MGELQLRPGMSMLQATFLRRRPGVGQPWIVRRDAGLRPAELLPVLRMDGRRRHDGQDEDG